jgi:hypothetical protein
MPAALLDPDHRIGRQPVVGMDDIESAQEIFHLEHPVDKGAAHAVDVLDEVGLAWIRAPVVMNPVYHVVTGLTRGAARKHMD